MVMSGPLSFQQYSEAKELPDHELTHRLKLIF